MCLSPVIMYYTGAKTASGKRKLSAGRPSALYRYEEIPVPCGKCPACLERKRKEWITRLSLERFVSGKSCFVTLTYDDLHLPSDRKVSKRDVQLFLKRFRQLGRKYQFLMPCIKYFIVSEYGKKFHRPHYHGLFFGVDCLSDPVWQSKIVAFKGRYPIYSSPLLSDAWSNGFVSVDAVTNSSIRYVSKYITKGSVDKSDDNFRLLSRRLGASFFFDTDDSGKPVELTVKGRQHIENGFVVLNSKDRFFKVPVPRFVERYLESIDNPLRESVVERRKTFALNTVDSVSPSLHAESIILKWSEENKRRLLDNDS